MGPVCVVFRKISESEGLVTRCVQYKNAQRTTQRTLHPQESLQDPRAKVHHFPYLLR